MIGVFILIAFCVLAIARLLLGAFRMMDTLRTAYDELPHETPRPKR